MSSSQKGHLHLCPLVPWACGFSSLAGLEGGMETVSDKIHGAGWGWVWRRLEVGVSKLGVQVLVDGSDSGDGMTLGVPGFGQSLTD